MTDITITVHPASETYVFLFWDGVFKNNQRLTYKEVIATNEAEAKRIFRLIYERQKIEAVWQVARRVSRED